MIGTGDIMFGIILSFIITALVAGYGISDNSYPWEHEAATKSCVNNGGYEKMAYDFEIFQKGGDSQRYVVKCKDGAEFSYNGKSFKSLVELNK